MKSIFFITKPLELLGAIEARNQLKLDNCLLIIKSDKKDDETLNFLIEKSGNWNHIIRTKKKSSYGVSWIKLIKKLQKESYDYLFSRAFPIASYFINNLRYNHLYLLDDGHATVNIADEFKKNKNLTNRFSLFKGKNKAGIKYSIVESIYKSLNIFIEKPVESIGFYTYYDLGNIPNVTVLKNNFSWFASLKTKDYKVQEDIVYIIGTNVVAAKILSQKDYVTTLKKIALHYKDKEIVYIPHGRETEERIAGIKSELNCEIRRNKFNVELDFALRNEQPKIVVGSISTALITLKKIYKEEIQISFFNFDNTKIAVDKIEAVSNLNEYQKKFLDYIELTY
ncbi:polysialyltransferase family glycosyltransferase [Tenacibaculum sp. M341]|uniref:polysialyltransferase family glycosyltransferase n=1 Tax=Tenacibaculum sp. M341 TaxID=2530339 RepID=UPI00104EE274|nr:polysialyltransferase family glycosyltransferase [Tenacibaculum sp. M341]TCI95032.1 hypothetical protein EYW44_01535 [Tenacibaculum sp. M341]